MGSDVKNPANPDWPNILAWYGAMGADEAIGDEPCDRFQTAPTPAARPPQAAPAAAEPRSVIPRAAMPANAGPVPEGFTQALTMATEAAAAAQTLAELRAAVTNFNGCALRMTATHTVFADGDPAGGVMLIGEAPGAEEDRIGLPFVGPSGQLLDRMLATIGLDRTRAYIANTLFWRPPGNRKPTAAEIDLCRPFVLRHIALAQPRILVLVGGVASSALVPGSEGIMRLRGRWFDLPVAGLAHPVPTIAMYHPSFLLRSPERKRESWLDLLSIKSKLE